MTEFQTRRRKPNVNERARLLRQGDNVAEAVLWNELKDRNLGGHKFVRQFPVDLTSRISCVAGTVWLSKSMEVNTSLMNTMNGEMRT